MTAESLVSLIATPVFAVGVSAFLLIKMNSTLVELRDAILRMGERQSEQTATLVSEQRRTLDMLVQIIREKVQEPPPPPSR